MINRPTVVPIGCCEATLATYQNNLNATTSGIVFVVLHNRAGQTVYFTAASMTITPGGNQTGDLVLYGLTPGASYNASFFAALFSGVAISVETSNVTLTMPT